MKGKSLLTAVLLLFVAVSVVYAVIKEVAGSQASPARGQSSLAVTAAEEVGNSKEAPQKILVYYFYGSKRCTTCKTIEAYAKEVVETRFAEALQDGSIAWQAINVEETENTHYVQDFELVGRAVVVVEQVNGKTSRWQNLEEIWTLVSEKRDFFEYIENAIRAY